MKPDRFEDIDRDMSSWVLTCEHNGTRFFVNDEGTYTDRLGRARRFRWADQAEAAVAEQHSDPGFDLRPMSVPEAMVAWHQCGPHQNGRCVRCGRVQGMEAR